METTTEINTLPALNLIASHSKADLTVMARQAVSNLDDEGGDMLTLIAHAAKIEHFASEVKKSAKVVGLEELHRYGKEPVTKSGVRLQVRETGVTFDYERDAEWNEINAQMDELHTKLCQRETFLKSLPVEGMAVCNKDGEWSHCRPPVRRASTGIAATIL